MVFAAMLMLKGFSYSLNNPCKEILYQVSIEQTVTSSFLHYHTSDSNTTN